MNEPKMILVPVDLSERSRTGVAYAAMLANGLGARLLLTTNVNMPELAVLEDFAAAEHLTIDEAGDIRLRRLANELAPDAEIETAFSFNDFPADGILDVAAEHEVDMIVLASHGRSGMTRWLLGSVAEKVARAAEVPVVIVPARDR